MSSAYLRLLIFFPTILIPASSRVMDASSSPAFRMMCSAYKLNEQGNSIQPWCTTPFLILNQSVFHVQFCFFLTSIRVKTPKWAVHSNSTKIKILFKKWVIVWWNLLGMFKLSLYIIFCWLALSWIGWKRFTYNF